MHVSWWTFPAALSWFLKLVFPGTSPNSGTPPPPEPDPDKGGGIDPNG